MQHRKLGRSGLQVSAVSLGSWLTIGNTVDQEAATRLVRRAHELGVNLFDTADVYARGEAEVVLGQAIAGMRREHLVLASKCFFPMSDDVNDRGLSRKHVLESAHSSLRRLRTEYLDLFQCHRNDPETPVEETVMAMDDLIRQGKLLYWGVSCWPAWRIAEAVRFARSNGLHAPISHQPLYNLFDRAIEEEVLPACEALGLSQIVYSPLAQGVLTGKYRAGADGPDANTRAGNPRINQFIGRYLTAERLQQVEGLVALAARRDVRPGQLALAWCLHRSQVASVIVGATSEAQLEENVKAADLRLPPELVAELEDLFPA